MQIIALEISEVKVLVPKKFGDPRGFFSETYNRKSLADLGIDKEFVQDNHSLSAEKSVVRALHYQLPPMAQDKLVRVVRGAILDVAVDIRRASPSFGRYVAAVISAENWRQMYVPIGFAHGFVTLEPNTEVVYKVTNYYSPAHERGIRWNDSALGVDWGVSEADAVLSKRDTQHPAFKDVGEMF